MKFEDLVVGKRSTRLSAELSRELRELQEWGYLTLNSAPYQGASHD